VFNPAYFGLGYPVQSIHLDPQPLCLSSWQKNWKRWRHEERH